MIEMNYNLVLHIIKEKAVYLGNLSKAMFEKGKTQYTADELNSWAELRQVNSELETITYFFRKTQELNASMQCGEEYRFPMDLISPKKITDTYELVKKLTSNLNPNMGNARGRYNAMNWLEALITAMEETEAKQRKRWEI